MWLRAYGLLVDCGLPLPGLEDVADGPEKPAGGDRIVHVRAAAREQLERAWSGRPPQGRHALRTVDGRRLTIERGAAGDIRMAWGDDGLFHLAPGGELLLCWAPGRGDARWRRVLLDTVLATVALARGREALHAGAAVVEGGAVAVMAGTGGGKTSVVAELVARGSPLLCDDVLAVEMADGAAVGHPAPAMMSLPLAAASGLEPERIGRVLAELDGEAWIAARRAATGPEPLRALVLLEREPRRRLAVERMPAHPLPLLFNLLDSGEAPRRRALRFALAGDLAERVPLLRLAAPLEAPPARLAQVLWESLGSTER